MAKDFLLIEVEAINELEEEFEKKLGVPMDWTLELLDDRSRISTLTRKQVFSETREFFPLFLVHSEN